MTAVDERLAAVVKLTSRTDAETFVNALLANDDGTGRDDLAGLYLVIWTLHNKRTHMVPADRPEMIINKIVELDSDPAATAVYIGLGLVGTTYGPNERQDAKDVVGLFATWADLDVAGHGHSDSANLPPTFDDAHILIKDTGCAPTVILNSGNGLQAFWRLTEAMIIGEDGVDHDELTTFAADWVLSIKCRAQARGWKTDSVTDLARVMRAGGSTNTKGPDGKPTTDRSHWKTARVEHADSTAIYNPDELREHMVDETELASLRTTHTAKADMDGIDLNTIATRARSTEYRERGGLPAWLADLIDMEEGISPANTSIADAWHGRLTGMDRSGNVVDMALCNRIVKAVKGSEEKLAEAIVCRRIHFGDKPDKAVRVDYVARTIGKVLAKYNDTQPAAAPMSVPNATEESDNPAPETANTTPDTTGTTTTANSSTGTTTTANSSTEPAPQQHKPSRFRPTGDVPDLKDRDRFSYDDRGNGLRFIALYQDSVARDKDQNVTRTWQGTHWDTDNGDDMRVYVEILTDYMLVQGKDWVRDAYDKLSLAEKEKRDTKAAEAEVERAKQYLSWVSQSRMGTRLRECAKSAVAHPKVRVPSAKWDADPRLFNVANGTLELEFNGDVIFREHRKEDRITQKSSTVYDPAATCPMFNAYLERVQPNPAIRRLLWALAGLSLIGGNPYHVFPILIGKTRSGKSTWMTIIGGVLDNDEDPAIGYAGTFPLALLRPEKEQRGNPMLMSILPKRIAWTSEANDGLELQADHVKRFASDDRHAARDNYATKDKVANKAGSFTPFMVTNEVPQIKGADEAVKERLIPVPFGEYLKKPERDPLFPQKVLATERSGILNAILTGYADLMAHPEILQELPAECADTAAQMYETLNIYARFVADCCEPCPCDDRSGCVSTANSWTVFTQYCDDAREESGTDRMFGNAMVEMGYPSKDEKHRRKIGGKVRQVNVRRGLRLKSDSIEPVTPGHSDAVDLEQFDN